MDEDLEDKKPLIRSRCKPSPNRLCFVSSVSSVVFVEEGVRSLLSCVADGESTKGEGGADEFTLSAEMGLPEASSRRRKQVTAVQPEWVPSSAASFDNSISATWKVELSKSGMGSSGFECS